MTMPDSERDTANGIRKASDGSYMFNMTAVNFDEDRKYISIGDKNYKVFRGLMEVLTMKSPRDCKYSPEDVDAYLEIVNKYGNPDSLTGNSHRKKWLDKVGTMEFRVADSIKMLEKAEKKAKKTRKEQPTNLSMPRPLVQSTRYDDMEDPNEPIVSDEERLKSLMKSYGSTPFRKGSGLMPSNPSSLYKLLNLRLAAYKAGNTGLRNEVIAISDELLRQGVIKREDYKKITMIVT